MGKSRRIIGHLALIVSLIETMVTRRHGDKANQEKPEGNATNRDKKIKIKKDDFVKEMK